MSVYNRHIIGKVYQEALQKHPKGIKSYRWRYKKEQEIRFEELFKVTDSKRNLAKKSILDVGCGRGDLYKYLVDKGIQIKYTGIDLLPEFISEARRCYPKVEFIEEDFLRWQTSDMHNYIIASGLLSVKLPGSNKKYLQASVKKMLKLAQRGVAFNFLTTSRKEKFKCWYYYNPGEILDWCLSLKTVDGIAFTTGYDPWDKFGDATILLFKKG